MALRFPKRLRSGIKGALAQDPISPKHLRKTYTRETFDVAADNLAGTTQIAAGARVVLEFELSNPHSGSILVEAVPWAAGGGNAKLGNATGFQYVVGYICYEVNEFNTLAGIIATEKHTEAIMTRENMGSGVTSQAYTYVPGEGMVGWYSSPGDQSGIFAGANSKLILEGVWLKGDTTLAVAIRSEAASGGPFAIGGTLNVLY